MPPRQVASSTAAGKKKGKDTRREDEQPSKPSASTSNKGKTVDPPVKHVTYDLDDSEGDLSSDADSDAGSQKGVETDSIPREIIDGRYCLFCYEYDKSKKHHSVPTPAEVQGLESKLLQVQRETRGEALEDAMLGASADPVPDSQGQRYRMLRYTVLQWKLERARELRKKGFGACFDLWIDHLTISEMISDGWPYDAIRSKIPDAWIVDPSIPEFLTEKRTQYPPGAPQKGNIEADVMRRDEECLLDITDDFYQEALRDEHRIRNSIPTPKLETQNLPPIGQNLGLEAAHAAIKLMHQTHIPQTIRMWRNNANPPTHLDSTLQMRNYLTPIHTFNEPNAPQNPSMDVYRAIANIAFSMDSANRAWKSASLTDESYLKLTDDGYKQLAGLRDRLDKEGVTGLPPLAGKPPKSKPVQQQPLRPFVIDRWMDSKDSDLHRPFAYDPNRPLRPMLSGNAARTAGVGAAVGGSASRGDQEADGKGKGKGKKKSAFGKMPASREEIASMTMELDQLVDEI